MPVLDTQIIMQANEIGRFIRAHNASSLGFGRYGGPEVQEFFDRPDPVRGRDEVLIRVAFAGVNPLDHLLRSRGCGRAKRGRSTPSIADPQRPVVSWPGSCAGVAMGHRTSYLSDCPDGIQRPGMTVDIMKNPAIPKRWLVSCDGSINRKMMREVFAAEIQYRWPDPE
ncbi:hypothetical protein ACFVUS_24150 [Nocardia sp. NPDC058058]|uniref:hypothetical protein n=1 Tax=Nocardia sp. NPDC058058 TaxID=3346317 RepID=UPI0036D983D6